MRESEAIEQMARVVKFRALEKVRNEIQLALSEITEGGGTSPFTGNARESRKIRSLSIDFAMTQGGAPSIDVILRDLHIEAYDFGLALTTLLRAKLSTVEQEIEKI